MLVPLQPTSTVLSAVHLLSFFAALSKTSPSSLFSETPMATLFLRDRSSDNPSDAARLVPRLAFFGQLPQIKVMIVELVALMRKTPATPPARSQALSFACHLRLHGGKVLGQKQAFSLEPEDPKHYSCFPAKLRLHFFERSSQMKLLKKRPKKGYTQTGATSS